MAQRFNRACRFSGCGVLTREPNGFCEKHQVNANDVRNAHNKQRMATDPVWKMYGWRWQLLKKMLRVQGWVMCQRLINGVQCMQMAELYHHIWSPRVRPDLMYAPENICGLCREHHPDSEGTPEWIAGHDYVPTVMTLPSDFGKEQHNDSV